MLNVARTDVSYLTLWKWEGKWDYTFYTFVQKVLLHFSGGQT